MEAFVGLVMADELLLPPWFELRPEATEHGLDPEPEPVESSEKCFEARSTCLDCPRELGREV